MGFGGELGVGAGFLGVGLWQAYTSVKSYNKLNEPSGRSLRAQGFPRYAELGLIVLLAGLHMILNLVAAVAGNEDNNGAGVGAAISVERICVAAVFLLYAVVALVREGTPALPLPSAMVDCLAVFAFGEEFAFFYLTGGDDDQSAKVLGTQYDTLLLVPIGVCLLAIVMEISYPVAILPPIALSMALILQGTWFFQRAVSLFSKKWMASGCDLVQNSEGIYTVICDGMSLMRGRALATLQFNCHLALLLVLFLLPMYVFLNKGSSVPTNYERIGDDVVVIEGARENDKELSQSRFVHVLEDEDDEVL